jgi:hypothetical protein
LLKISEYKKEGNFDPGHITEPETVNLKFSGNGRKYAFSLEGTLVRLSITHRGKDT